MDLLDDEEYLYNPYTAEAVRTLIRMIAIPFNFSIIFLLCLDLFSSSIGQGSDVDEDDDDVDDVEILPDESAKASRDLSSSKIFSLQNSGWKAKQYGGARIKHVGAAGNLLFCATDRGRVIRWNLHTGDEQVRSHSFSKRNEIVSTILFSSSYDHQHSYC